MYLVIRKYGDRVKYWNAKRREWVRDTGDLIDATGYKSEATAINAARKINAKTVYTAEVIKQ